MSPELGTVRDLSCRDHLAYHPVIQHLEETFHKHSQELQRVRELAGKIKEGIARISPFIQQNTEAVCPVCEEMCCIRKHGYYNYEDLVYMHALGLKPPDYDFAGKDSDPCQFLSDSGCSLERSMRPSGCNWYFCDPLLERIEKSPDYHKFDNSLTNLAELWMKMMEEFAQVS